MSKILKFIRPADKPDNLKKSDDSDVGVRLSALRESIDRLNNLMKELRDLANETEPNDDKRR